MMNFGAVPPEGAQINDIAAINAVIAHPDVYGEDGRIVDVEDRLVITVPGIAVCFRDRGAREHECHQAVIPEMRGKTAIAFMRNLAAWWWQTQPSDTVFGPIPDNCRSARFTMHALGFHRDHSCSALCIDGTVRQHVVYKMERPR